MRRIKLDERPHHAAVAQARGKASGPTRWRVIDLTDAPPPAPLPPDPIRIVGGRRDYEARRWGPTPGERRTDLAAGAEGQEPGPLPAVFRLDPLSAAAAEGGRRAN